MSYEANKANETGTPAESDPVEGARAQHAARMETPLRGVPRAVGAVPDAEQLPADEPLPDPEAEFRPTLAQLIAIIQAGGVEEMTTRDGVNVVHIDSSPKGRDEVWVGPDGLPVSAFGRKFAEGFSGWQPGEIVNAEFVARFRGGGIELIVSDSYVGDICHADTFKLDLSHTDAEALRGVGMALVNADVMVTSAGECDASDMFTYAAQVHRVNAVQKPWDGVTALETGQQVLVEGEVVRYEPAKLDYTNRVDSTVDIRIGSGDVVSVEMTGGYIVYEGGNLDMLHPVGLQVGDRAQVNATFSSISSSGIGPERTPVLNAPFCRSAFLLAPSAEREAIYGEHRADVAARLAHLHTLDGAEFRKAYGELLRTYVCQGDAIHKRTTSLLTDKENAALRDLADAKFPDIDGHPSPDRPISKIRTVHAAEISDSLGVNAYGMSRTEFQKFATGIACGAAASTTDDIYHSGPALVSTEVKNLSPEEQFQIAVAGVDYWIPLATGCYGCPENPPHVPGVKTDYIAKSYLQRLERLSSNIPEARTKLYKTAVKLLRDETTVGSSDVGLSPWDLCDLINGMVLNTGHWDHAEGWQGITDPAGISYFIDKLPELSGICQQFSASDNKHGAAEVIKLIEKIKQFQAMPPYASEP